MMNIYKNLFLFFLLSTFLGIIISCDPDDDCIMCETSSECADILGDGWVCQGGCCTVIDTATTTLTTTTTPEETSTTSPSSSTTTVSGDGGGSGIVPDTGQTESYTDDTWGEDSDYTINPHSYTDLENGIVRDNVTGLMWEIKQDKDGTKNYANPHDADNEYTWYDSNSETNGGDAGTPGLDNDTEDFLNELNAANYGGYNDWRMPSVKELSFIRDMGRYNPAINTSYFPETQSDRYWSSSTAVPNMHTARYVHFANGTVDFEDKSNGIYVRAVRSEQPEPLDHFIDNGDGTVTDTETGLMWQQATAPGFLAGELPNKYTWKEAINYCEDLSWGDYNDWRLPNANELQSLVNYDTFNPTIDTSYFPDTQVTRYWSSTTHAKDMDSAWEVSFYNGSVDGLIKSAAIYVRAVRTGQ